MTRATPIALLSLLALTGCLRGNKSEPCSVLEDCLCGSTVGADRTACLEGTNAASLAVDRDGLRLDESQCSVVLTQLGAGCPSGDLDVTDMEPSPARRCVHDNDCARVDCACGGSAAVVADVRACVDGACMDGEEECNRRCLAARLVRGNACAMLRQCRCAPLLDDPAADDDFSGVADLTECLSQISASSPEACLTEAGQSAPDGLEQTLPTLACPDAASFISEP